MNEIFKIVKLEDKEYYTIVIGNRIATDKEFATEEEAKEYRDKVNWDLCCTLIIAMMDGMKTEIINELKSK